MVADLPAIAFAATYELDGRQYVLTSSGGVMFAWALPQSANERKLAATTAHPQSR